MTPAPDSRRARTGFTAVINEHNRCLYGGAPCRSVATGRYTVTVALVVSDGFPFGMAAARRPLCLHTRRAMHLPLQSPPTPQYFYTPGERGTVETVRWRRERVVRLASLATPRPSSSLSCARELCENGGRSLGRVGPQAKRRGLTRRGTPSWRELRGTACPHRTSRFMDHK